MHGTRDTNAGPIAGFLLILAVLFTIAACGAVALAALLITAFWKVDPYTADIVTEWTLDNIVTVITGSLAKRSAGSGSVRGQRQ